MKHKQGYTAEKIMRLADAYASQLQVCNFDDADKARDALEAALSAKQGEAERDCATCKHVNSAPSQNPCNSCMDSAEYHGFVDDSPFCKCGSTHPAPVAKQEAVNKEVQIMKLEGFLDALIEADPDRAERFMESALAKVALRNRLAERKATHPAPSVNAQEPCDMGQMCLNCQPRGLNGECPDKATEAKQEPVNTALADCESAFKFANEEMLARGQRISELEAEANNWSGEFWKERSHGFELKRHITKLEAKNAQMLDALKRLVDEVECPTQTVNKIGACMQARAAIAAAEGKI